MEKHRGAVTEMMQDERTRRAVLASFGLRTSLRAGQVFDELQRWGASQADLALTLIRLRRTAAASALIGRRVPTVCPPALREAPQRRMAADEEDDLLDRVIVSVEPNPRLPTTPAWHRYREFRVGRTLRSCLTRGVTRRDVRGAVRRGWIRTRRPT